MIYSDNDLEAIEKIYKHRKLDNFILNCYYLLIILSLSSRLTIIGIVKPLCVCSFCLFLLWIIHLSKICKTLKYGYKHFKRIAFPLIIPYMLCISFNVISTFTNTSTYTVLDFILLDIMFLLSMFRSLLHKESLILYSVKIYDILSYKTSPGIIDQNNEYKLSGDFTDLELSEIKEYYNSINKKINIYRVLSALFAILPFDCLLLFGKYIVNHIKNNNELQETFALTFIGV